MMRNGTTRSSTRWEETCSDLLQSGEPQCEFPPPNQSAISWKGHRSRRADGTPGEAGPVRDLLGGGHAPAGLILGCKSAFRALSVGQARSPRKLCFALHQSFGLRADGVVH